MVVQDLIFYPDVSPRKNPKTVFGSRFRAANGIIPLIRFSYRRMVCLSLKACLLSWTALRVHALTLVMTSMSWLTKEEGNPFPLAILQWLLPHLPFGMILEIFSAKPSLSALYSFYWLRRWGSSLQLSFGKEVVPFPGASVGSSFLFCFFLPGIYVAVSRTQDYRHHASDVIAGAIIGTFITTVVFLQYYSFQPKKLRKTYPKTEISAIHRSSSTLWSVKCVSYFTALLQPLLIKNYW